MLTKVYFAFLSVSFLVSVTTWFRKGEPHLKILSLVLAGAVMVETYAIFLFRKMGHTSNLEAYNIYMFFEFLGYAAYYLQVFRKKFSAAFALVFLFLVPFIWFVSELHVFQEGAWNSYMALAECIFAAVCSILLFYELFTASKLVRLSRNPEFFIATGMLVYYAPSLPYLGALNFFISNDQRSAENLKIILQILNILMYSFFTYAYVCRISIKK